MQTATSNTNYSCSHICFSHFYYLSMLPQHRLIINNSPQSSSASLKIQGPDLVTQGLWCVSHLVSHDMARDQSCIRIMLLLSGQTPWPSSSRYSQSRPPGGLCASELSLSKLRHPSVFLFFPQEGVAVLIFLYTF